MHKKFVKATERSNNLELKNVGLKNQMSSLTADVRRYKSKHEASEKKLVTAQAELKQVKGSATATAGRGHSRSHSYHKKAKSPSTIFCEKSDICVQEHARKQAINLENKELERKRVVKDKKERLSILQKNGGLLGLSGGCAYVSECV
jgi:hypothetical protein